MLPTPRKIDGVRLRVPQIDVGDVLSHEVVWLKEADEAAIAELAEQSFGSKAAADFLERQIAADAEKIIADFHRGVLS